MKNNKKSNYKRKKVAFSSLSNYGKKLKRKSLTKKYKGGF